MGEKGRHSRGSGNPVLDLIQLFEILDARFRWDKLRGNDKPQIIVEAYQRHHAKVNGLRK
jgi:hypothetical protein